MENITVNVTEKIISREKQLPIIRSAVSLSCLPIKIAALGAPPDPANMEMNFFVNRLPDFTTSLKKSIRIFCAVFSAL